MRRRWPCAEARFVEANEMDLHRHVIWVYLRTQTEWLGAARQCRDRIIVLSLKRQGAGLFGYLPPGGSL